MSRLAGHGFGFMEQTDGVSPEARHLAENMVGLLVNASFSRAGSLRRKDELHDVANQYGLLRTYDGLMALKRASAFLDALPPKVSQPVASVDPDREIAFDWYEGEDFLSLSVGAAGVTSYAAEIDGVEYVGKACPGTTLPPDLLHLVNHFARSGRAN